MPVGAALAAASVGSAGIGAFAANSAAKTQASAARDAGQYQLQAAQLAAQLQLGMFNTIRGDLSPYRNFGAGGLSGIAALMGLPQQSPQAGAGSPSTVVNGGLFGGLAGGGGNNPLTVPGLDGSFGGLTGGGPPRPNVGDLHVAQLFQQRPDVLREAQRVTGTGEFPSLDAYASWWNQHYGQPTGYQAPTWSQDQIDQAFPQAGGSTPGATPGGAPGTPAPTGGPLGGGTSQDIQSFLENTPGYQFARGQGMQAVENSLSSRGLGGLSGSLGKGLSRFVTGLADQTYQQQLANFFQVAGIGQSAANQTGAYGNSAAQGAGGSLVGGAGAYGNGIIGAANASAAGTVGAANAISGGLQGGANGYLTSQLLGMYGGGGGSYPASTVTGSQGDLLGSGYGDFGGLFGGG